MVKALFAEALEAKTAQAEKDAQTRGKDLGRLSIERDGIMARMRRGSVPMEKQEQQRPGDVYREVKGGATFVR